MTASSPASGAPTGGRDALLAAVIAWFAEHGIGDASLRKIASGVGSSHRMLIYHFGSREGLLTAVVERLEEAERDTLTQILSQVDGRDRRELGWEFWTHVADVVEFYGPLYFELASHAMRGDDANAPLRIPNVHMWLEAMSELWSADGQLGEAEVAAQARLSLAVARGLLHDLLLTGDRAGVDEAMARFDWLSFGEPNPDPRVKELTRNWRR